MSNINLKRKALNKWLDNNPEKTERDWLLEAVSQTKSQRRDLNEFFIFLDENNLANGIFIAPPTEYYEVTDNVGDACDFPSENHRKVGVEYDFLFCGIPYDLSAPDDVYQNKDDERSTDSSWRYLRWKASQENLEETNFSVIAYKAHFGFHTGYPHWKSYYEKWQEKTKNIQ